VDFATFLRRLGRNLRRARWRKGLRQEDVAGEGFTYRYVQELERGVRNPSVKMLFDLAQVLDVRVADLVEVGERKAPVKLANVRVPGTETGAEAGAEASIEAIARPLMASASAVGDAVVEVVKEPASEPSRDGNRQEDGQARGLRVPDDRVDVGLARELGTFMRMLPSDATAIGA
jgi:transcriptional regulator with XRE-family HTH domain